MTEFNASFKFYYNNPLYNKFRNFKSYKNIMNEVNKLGLPYPTDVKNNISKENLRLKMATTVCLISIFGFLYKVKSITLINKLTLSGIFYYGVFFFYNQRCYEKLLDMLLLSDTIIGQETRIITKWFMPEHSKSILLDQLISDFKIKVKSSKEAIENKKKTIKSVVETELEDNESFIRKLKEKIDRE
jgi:hypothetical protein